MRVAIDATSAVTQQAGVGRYTRELVRALVQLPSYKDQYALVAAAGEADSRSFLDELSPGAWRELRRVPLPERAMTIFWQRLRVPLAIEHLVGEFDLFHGPDFVTPPTRHPTVVTIHDLSYLLHPEFAEPNLAKYLRMAVPRALRQASAVITVSASVAAEVERSKKE